jgi:hypothetical protein
MPPARCVTPGGGRATGPARGPAADGAMFAGRAGRFKDGRADQGRPCIRYRGIADRASKRSFASAASFDAGKSLRIAA